MATVIRLTRIGKHKRPFYRIVVADSRKPRDGRFLEILGTFDPLAETSAVQFKEERAADWVQKGARISETVHRLFKKQGLFQQLKAVK
ncbi:MAG TPA: 30S ribosomal protein S16 [Nitrospiria bacterium]|nr:30S ribosomal protein S16 [Nitrospiria bacterium]